MKTYGFIPEYEILIKELSERTSDRDKAYKESVESLQDIHNQFEVALDTLFGFTEGSKWHKNEEFDKSSDGFNEIRQKKKAKNEIK